MSTTQKMFRSDTYQNIFPDDMMLAAFDTTTPTQQQKNEYFFNCWMNWKDNACKCITTTTPSSFKTATKKFCNEAGLKEFWDYQVKGYQVRFKEPTMKAFYKVAMQGQFTLC